MLGKSYRFYAIVCVTVVALLASFVAMVRPPEGAPGISAPSGAKVVPVKGVVEAPKDLGSISITSEENFTTRPLSEIKAIPPEVKPKEIEHDNEPLLDFGHIDGIDPVVQTEVSPKGINALSGPLTIFNGPTQADGCGNCAPPDPTAEVGPNHVIAAVNSSFIIYDRAGTKLYGPAQIKTLWSGGSTACTTRNDGDPIVLYDQFADRWMISQFTAASPYYECIAVSATSNPLGTWYAYAFQLSTSDFPDYPHFGIVPDISGYYMTVNWFVGGTTYGGPRPYVFERTQMLAGLTARALSTSGALGSSIPPLLPADVEGPTGPASGSAALFISGGSTLKLYKMTPNWGAGTVSWTGPTNITPASYSTLCSTTRNCVPQKGTTTKLDGIGDRTMFKAVYRKIGSTESLLLTQSVDADSTSAVRAGTRWYEIRTPYGTPSIYQQGTYGPADGLYRWMGSMTMNGKGEIGLGFSASNSTNYPSIRAVGRLPGDTLGTLPQGEITLYAGTGFQSGVNRWGDYTHISVDPVDDCTFWYIGEFNNSGGWAWATKIASFRVGTCP